MTIGRHSRGRRGRRKRVGELKDRLIQTRVPGDLEDALKEEARKRRLSVSHLIRNVLEDTFHLVDNVVAEVDNLVNDSVGLAKQVSRDAGRIANSAKHGVRAATRSASEADDDEDDDSDESREPAADPLAQVLAWNEVVMNQAGRCARCGKTLAKGSKAHLGLTATPGSGPIWLCGACISKLSRP
jgi:hypothetical protein